MSTFPQRTTRGTGTPAGSAPNAQSQSKVYSVFEGDPDMIDLIRLFVEELPGRIDELTGSLRARDLTELKRFAHQLKGAGGGYGFPQISEAAGRLEAAVLPHVKPSAAGTLGEKVIAALTSQVDELAALCGRAAVR